MKKIISAAVFASGALIGVSGYAQTLPDNMPNQTNPPMGLPREISPSNPGQVAPPRPDFDQKLPGQPNTIPEVMERPGAVNPPQQMTRSPEDIRKAQEALKAKGYDPGAVSGNLHAGTQEALRRFQKANNLPMTGVLDAQTADKLGVSVGKDDTLKSTPNMKSTAPDSLAPMK